MFKLELEKPEEPEIELLTSVGKRIPEKTFISASLITRKVLTVWITTNYGKFFKRWEYQTTLPIFRETRMQVKKQQLELDKEQ